MGFTNHFTGLPIQPSTVSYQLFDFDIIEANIVLNWATSFVDTDTAQPNTAAGQNDIETSTLNPDGDVPWIITLPPANQVSVGQQLIFTNKGIEPVEIQDNAAGFLVAVAATQEFRLYLTDNTTAEGVWGITQFGAGTAAAQASQLSGLGLVAENNLLNSNIPTKSIGANYQILATDLASLIVSTGGSNVFTMPANGASVGGYTVGLGWYVGLNNASTGTLTVNGNGNSIDGTTPITLVPGQSTYLVYTNQGWNTIGRGIPNFFTDNPVTIPITSTAQTLTPTQQQNNLITFTGILTGNTIVTFQSGIPGSWYIYNQTTGNSSLSIIVNGSALPAVTLPSNSQTINYSNGINMYQTPTVVAPSTFTFLNGSEGTPSIGFQQSVNTGFYSVDAYDFGFSSAGTQSMNLGSQLEVAGGTNTAPGYAFLGDSNTGIYSDSTNTISFTTNGNLAGGFSADQTLILEKELPVTSGGTGVSTLLTYGLLCGGTTATNPVQAVLKTSAGPLLQSTGTTSLPAWTTATYPTTITNNQMLVGSGTNVIASSTVPTALSSTITTLGVVATGTWNAGIIPGQYGGTGIANTGKTITLGGNLVTSGANALTLTTTGTTNVTLPTSGTLIANPASVQSFTPTLAFSSGSVGYATQTGKYWQTGKIVNFTINITLNAMNSASGSLSINASSLPNYNSAMEGDPIPINCSLNINLIGYNLNPTYASTYVATFTSGGVISLKSLISGFAGNTATAINASYLGSSTSILISGSYVAA